MQEAKPILVGSRRPVKFTILQRFNQKWILDKDSGCHVWTASTLGAHGYGQFRVRDGSEGTPVGAHRVSWTLHRGLIPSDLCVLHKCDRPLCVNPEHLFLGTVRDNNADAKRKGRSSCGFRERHWKAKFTEQQVASIRCSTDSRLVLARRYSVHPETISKIRNMRSWTRTRIILPA